MSHKSNLIQKWYSKKLGRWYSYLLTSFIVILWHYYFFWCFNFSSLCDKINDMDNNCYSKEDLILYLSSVHPLIDSFIHSLRHTSCRMIKVFHINTKQTADSIESFQIAMCFWIVDKLRKNIFTQTSEKQKWWWIGADNLIWIIGQPYPLTCCLPL